ncbi:MAG TPA: hypothetical protein VIK07_01925, partial [Bacteroidales bacterium]
MKIKSVYKVLLLLLIILSSCNTKNIKIDRLGLVTRNNIKNSLIDSLNSLSVGNGEFAFTVDITGLQTFPEFYSKGISLGTMSNWGWHTSENPENYQLNDVYKNYTIHGRSVDYVHQYRAAEDARKVAASDWLRANPHRIHLGMIGLQIFKKDGTEISISDIKDPVQKLNLWTGEIDSKFFIEGEAVHLITICHPNYDNISVKIVSGLIEKNRLKIKINFPLGVSSPNGYDFNSPEKHTTKIQSETTNVTIFSRSQDNDKYNVLLWRDNGGIKEVKQHSYIIEPSIADSSWSFSCQFYNNPDSALIQTFDDTEAASKTSWEKYWTSGGAVDFSQCTDARAPELERRVILSQYLTKIQ